MFKLFVFSALVAYASAGLIGAPLAAPLAAPYGGIVAPYAAHLGAPIAPLAAPIAPLAYSAAIPAPVTYESGYRVVSHVEPVEQHGYKIAY